MVTTVLVIREHMTLSESDSHTPQTLSVKVKPTVTRQLSHSEIQSLEHIQLRLVTVMSLLLFPVQLHLAYSSTHVTWTPERNVLFQNVCVVDRLDFV